MNNKYKDQCDKCKEFDYCKGFNELVLCKKCFDLIKIKNIRIVGDKNGQKRFDF